MQLKNVLYAILFLLLVIIVYSSIRIKTILRNKQFIGVIFKSFNEKYEERQIEKEARELYEGSIEEDTLIQKIDILFIRSGIKKYLPFMTTEILIIVSVLAALTASVVITIINGFWLYVIGAFITTLLAIILILKIMAKTTFDKIDNELLNLINRLRDASNYNNSIVTIFEDSIPYLNGPLKNYSIDFITECKSGVLQEEAFRNFTKKVENKRLKNLLKNLQICSTGNENYPGVLNTSSVIFNMYFSNKKDWTQIIWEGRIDFLLMAVAIGFCFNLMNGFTENGNLMETLKMTVGGNILLGYFLAIFIYTLYKTINLDKLNY